jgi:hypothetical protein
MNKAARLIKWQRLTIVVLLLGLITTGSYAYVYRCRLHATEILFLRDMQKTDHTDHKIIHDQDVRLKKYEAKLNHIDPMRRLFSVRNEVGVDPLNGIYVANEAANILGRGGIESITIDERSYVRSSDLTRSRSILLKAKRFQIYRGFVTFHEAGTHR